MRTPCVVTPPCAPVYRPLPTSCIYPAIPYYSWGPSVIAYNTGNGFTTVSTPGYVAPISAPVYRVSPPVVIPTGQITTYPTTSFRWKH